MLRVEKLFYSSFSHLQLSITHVIISKESAVPQVPRHVFEDEKLSKRHVLEECKASKRHVSTILWGFCIYSCRHRQGLFHGRHDHRRLGRRQDRLVHRTRRRQGRPRRNVHVTSIKKCRALVGSWGEIEATDKLYHSKLYAQLAKEELKLWHYSPLTLCTMFNEEQRAGAITYPEEAC